MSIILWDGLEDALDPVLLAHGVPREHRDRGLKEIQLSAQAIGLEVQRADLRDRTLSDAVRDAAQFPNLNRTHNGIEDLLRLDLTKDLQPFVDSIRTPRSRPEFVKLAQQLTLVAAKGEQAEAAFARFVLFELLRFVRLIVTWRDRPSDLRVGLDDAEFDRITEAHMQTELAQVRKKGEKATSPLVFALTSTLLEADALRKDATTAFGALHPDIARPFALRAKIEDVLLDAQAADTVLVRNAFGPAWGQPKLEVVTLTTQHPLVLEDWDQEDIDDHTARATQALKKRDSLPIRRNALIDELLRHEGDSRKGRKQ